MKNTELPSWSRHVIRLDEDKVYRTIRKEHDDTWENFQKISETPEISKFFPAIIRMDKGLNGANSVLVVERLKYYTFVYEWTPLMLFDAMSFMVEFVRVLDSRGLGLRDGHSYNIFFTMGRFFFIDFDSVISGKSGYSCWIEIVEWFLNPLILCCRGEFQRSSYVLTHAMLGIKEKDIKGYLTDDEYGKYAKKISCSRELMERGMISEAVDILYEYTQENWKPAEPQENTSQWTHYYAECDNGSQPIQITGKQKAVLDAVKRLNPSSLVDIAGNSGWYSVAIVKELSIPAVCFDCDYDCIDMAYLRGKRNSVKYTMAYANFISPTPDCCYLLPGDNPYMGHRGPGVKTRFKSECALFLAVIHHLVFTFKMTFENIFMQLADFTDKYAIIEFCKPEGDPNSFSWYDPSVAWYNEDVFIKELEKHFDVIERLDAQSKCRPIFVCRKK